MICSSARRFLILRDYLSPGEVERAAAEFQAGLDRKDKSDRIAGPRLQLNWSNLDEHSPFIQSLLEDRRFFGVAQELLGNDAIGFDSNCNFYSGDRSPWHPDVGPELTGMKFTLYLSEVGATTGALRCIPGSHAPAFSESIDKVPLLDRNAWEGDGEEGGLAVDEVPATVLDSRPGDAVLFDFRLWHGSWQGGVDRRMFSLQYYQHPATSAVQATALDMHMQDAVAQRNELRAKGFQTQNKDGVFGTARGYPQYWLDNAARNPQRARWIRWLQGAGMVGGESDAPSTW